MSWVHVTTSAWIYHKEDMNVFAKTAILYIKMASAAKVSKFDIFIPSLSNAIQHSQLYSRASHLEIAGGSTLVTSVL